MSALRVAILFLLLPLALAWAAAEDPTDASPFYDWDSAGQIAVQAGGRIKPLDSFASELVKSVCGKSRFRNEHPVETYFQWMSDGERWVDEPLLYLPKGALRERLGLQSANGNHFSFSVLQAKSELRDLVAEAQALQESGAKLTFTHSKALDLVTRMQTLSDVFAHATPSFVPRTGGDAAWLAMPALLTALEDTTAERPSETEHALALGFMAM
ncbi:MAG: hypothetical protein PHI18_08495 [bacterium]|nr:hypothetical protein [bacterium]